MTEIEIKNTTISEYLELLKIGNDTEKCNSIGEWLNSKISGESSMDLQLLQMQKEVILFTAKLYKAVISGDIEKQIAYTKRIEELKAAIEIKTRNQGEKPDPYVSFLKWLLGLKKYFGSDIDRESDLMELVVATDQMLKFIESQEKQLNKMTKK